MQRHKVIGAVVVAATAGVLVAVTLPAMAGSEPRTAVRPGVPSGVAGTEALLPAIQRDLKMTRAEAERRLAGQRDVSALTTQARQRVGRAYAGAWVDAAGAVKVAVTDSAAAEGVRALGGQPVPVARSAERLTAAQQTLDRGSGKVPAGIAGWHIDQDTNTLTVLARRGGEKAARDYARTRTGLPAEAVQVETVNDSFKVMHDVRGGDAYFINRSARCSVGFAVTTGFVSAGHCGRTGASTAGFNQVAQGTFRKSVFGGANGNDYSVVDVNANWTPKPVVATKDGDVSITGSAEAAVGAVVCRTGSTTGTHCGKIKARDVTLTISGVRVKGFISTTVCAEPGDSGGSLVAGTEAQGVLSGGGGNCRSGGNTFYQPLNPILAENGLTLTTTAGPQPAPSATTTTSPSTSPATASPTASPTVSPTASATPSPTKPSPTADPTSTGPCDKVAMAPATSESGPAPVQFADGWDAAPTLGCTYVDPQGRKVVLTAEQNRMFYRVNQMRALQQAKDGTVRKRLDPDFCLQEFAQGYTESKPSGHSPLTTKFYTFGSLRGTGSNWIGENYGANSGQSRDKLAMVDRRVYSWFTSGTLTTGHYGNMMNPKWSKGGMGIVSATGSILSLQNFSANWAMWTDLDGTSCSQPPATKSPDSTLPPIGLPPGF